MKHNTRLSWTVALAIAAPVMALTGCPGLLGGTPTGASPTPGTATSPTPAPTPTPALRTTTVLTKLNIPASGDRTFTIKNLGSSAQDLTRWVISYENKAGTGNAKAMVHARIVGADGATLSLAPNTELVVSESTASTTLAHIQLEEDLGFSGAGVNRLGVQATHGSFVLYKGIDSSADLGTAGNLVDYLQYGNITQGSNTDPWTHAAAAVTAKVWESATATASAPGGTGASISVVTAGATGSTNWKKD